MEQNIKLTGSLNFFILPNIIACFFSKKNQKNNQKPSNPFLAHPAEPLASLLPGARYCRVSIIVLFHVSLCCWGLRPRCLRLGGDVWPPMGHYRVQGYLPEHLWAAVGFGLNKGHRVLMWVLGGSVCIFPLSVLLFVYQSIPFLCWYVLYLN